MNALVRFERLIEHLFEDQLIRRLSGPIQPVELAKKLAREMEAGSLITSGPIRVPNVYQVHFSPLDLQAYARQQAALERELAAFLVEHARERNLVPAGPLRVRLIADPQQPARQVRLEATAETTTPTISLAAGYTMRLTPQITAPPVQVPSIQAVLYLAEGDHWGPPIPVDPLPFTVGRGLENDLVLEDPRVSRFHARFQTVQGRLSVRDLDSSNGTFVNGEPVHERVLADTDRISFGGLEAAIRIA